MQTECIPGEFSGICCLHLNGPQSKGCCLKNIGECKLVRVCRKGENNLLKRESSFNLHAFI